MKLTEEKLSYLLFLYKNQKEKSTLTNAAGKLGITKSTLSKVLTLFYQEGITEDKGKLKLSKQGILLAREWQKDITKISEWLSSQAQISAQCAWEEAVKLAIHMSDDVKERLIQTHSMNQFLNLIDDVKMIHGDMLLSYLQDGDYPFAFTIYKDEIHNNIKISMANEGFIHPGLLRIKDAQGYFMLQNCDLERESLKGRAVLKGRLEELSYFKNKQFVVAAQWKDSFLIPISALEFYYNNQERLLQGHIKLKMKPIIKNIHMPETTAILSIILK